MDSRALAALLSTLISQIGVLIPLILSAPSSPIPISHQPSSTSSSSSSESIFSLIANFLSTAEYATTLSLIPLSPKRRRTHASIESNPNSDSEELSDKDSMPATATRLDELERVDPALPRNPDAFRLFFKMSPSTFEWLSGLLDPLLDCRDPVGAPLNLSSELRLGIGLYRLSSGSSYAEIASRFKVSERVARFCSKQLCRVLCTNFRFWVGFPNPNELKSVSDGFKTLTGLPNCCGVIDCIRFKIKRTGSEIEESIAAQLVVDSNSRILSIVAGFRGDNADLRILKSSTLYKDIKGGNLLNSEHIYAEGVIVPQYLIGDNEYPLLPWLLVPFIDPSSGSIEGRFNASCRMMRYPMGKTVASLRNWGILSKPMYGEIRNAVAYIGACAILHNAELMREDYSAFIGKVDEHLERDHGRKPYSLEEIPIDRQACSIRNALATIAKEVGHI